MKRFLNAGHLHFRRWAHCRSCGSEFQNRMENSPGFQDLTRRKRKPSIFEGSEDLFSQLSPLEINALNSGNVRRPNNAKSTVTPRALIEFKEAKKSLSETLHCRWCLESRSGHSNSIVRPTSHISPGNSAQVYHVIDAMDFPFGLPESHTPGTKYVVNRVDLVARHLSQVSKFKEYVMDEVFRKSNWRVPARDVFCVSALRQWGLKKLSESLGSSENWFVGDAAGGKSLLTLTMSGVNSAKLSCWPVPFKTQQLQKHKSLPGLYRSRPIVDTPSNPENSQIYDLLKPSFLRKVVGGTPMFGSDPRYLKVKVKARPGQVISIGGLVAFEFPRAGPGSSIHFFVAIGGLSETQVRTMRSIDKVNEVNASTDANHKSWSITNSTESLKKIADIQITRSHAIVIKGLGVIQPMLFGDLPENYFAHVWAQPGVSIQLRRDVQPYLFPKVKSTKMGNSAKSDPEAAAEEASEEASKAGPKLSRELNIEPEMAKN